MLTGSERRRAGLRAALGAALLVALFGGNALGCNWFDAEAPNDELGGERLDPDSEAIAVDDRLRAYAACRIAVATAFAENWDRYSDQVDDEGRPRRRREGVYLRGIPQSTFRGCRRAVALSTGGLEASSATRTATVELLAVAQGYAQLTRELASYLETEGWREDDWAELSVHDSRLRAAYGSWQALDRDLAAKLDAAHSDNDARLLVALGKRGDALQLATRRVVVEARPVNRCLMREPAATAGSCDAAYERFVSASERFKSVYETDRSAADQVFWMSTFANDVEELRTVYAEQLRRLGQRRTREPDRRALVEAYGSLMRDAETLNFDFP